MERSHWYIKGLERLVEGNDHPEPPVLKNGEWYFAILNDKLKYGQYISSENAFMGVDGKKYRVYNSDILTGNISPVDALIQIRGTDIRYHTGVHR